MAELFEIIMIVSFGFSWPMNVIKSYRARTTKGKSLAFLLLISIGYVFGIAGKLIGGNYKWYVLFFYVLNFIMVSADLVMYIRNYKLDKLAEERVDVFIGNHTWNRRDIYQFLDANPECIIRPANYPAACPGVGHTTLQISGFSGTTNITVSMSDPADAAGAQGDALDRQVVGLGPARGEDDVALAHAEHARDAGARVGESAGGGLADGVVARRVAVPTREKGLHRLEHRGANGRRRGVVEVEERHVRPRGRCRGRGPGPERSG